MHHSSHMYRPCPRSPFRGQYSHHSSDKTPWMVRPSTDPLQKDPHFFSSRVESSIGIQNPGNRCTRLEIKWFAIRVIVPRPLRKVREPLGSLLASYTLEELEGLMAKTKWAHSEQDLRGFLFAQILEARK